MAKDRRNSGRIGAPKRTVDAFGKLQSALLEPKNALALCIAVYAVYLLLSFANPSMPGGVDASTHLFQIGLIAREGLVAWNQWWYAGHPLLQQYPPIPHAVGALLSYFTGVEAAYKLVAAAAFFLLPISFFILVREFGLKEGQQSVALYAFSFAPVFVQYLQGGVLSALFAVPFEFLFLAFFIRSLREKEKWPLALAAIFLAVSALSHLFMPIAGGLVAVIYLLAFKPTWEAAKKLAAIAAGAALMVSFFWVPLAFSGKISDPAPDLASLSPIQLAVVVSAPFARAFMPHLSYYSFAMFGLAAVLGGAAAWMLWNGRREGRGEHSVKGGAAAFWRPANDNQRLVLFSALVVAAFLAWALISPLGGGQAGVKLPLLLPLVFAVLAGSAFGADRRFDALLAILIAMMLISLLLTSPPIVSEKARDLASWAAEKTTARALLLPQGYALATSQDEKTNSASYFYDVYLLPQSGKENYFGWFTESKPRREFDSALTFTCTRPRTPQEILSGLQFRSDMTTQTMKDCTLNGDETEFCETLQETSVDHVFANTNFPEVVAFAGRQTCLQKEDETDDMVAFRVLGAKPYVDGGLEYRKSSGSIEISFDGPLHKELVVRESYFRGWKAEIDGTEVPVERSEMEFLQVNVDAGPGRHILVLQYSPETFGGLFYLVSAVAWIGALAWMFIRKK